MLKLGVIEESHSSWSSPMVLVPKPDGSLRFCNDFRKLDEISRFDAYPMPRVDELIERLGPTRFLSTLDLTRGYWQITFTPQSRVKMAFVTPDGLFHYRVMPFGVHGAPATFQRLMDRVLRPHQKYAVAYLDDIVVHSPDWDTHLTQLEAVLTTLRKAGLTANAIKCRLGLEEADYLGYTVGRGRTRAQLNKVEAIATWPQPQTKKQAYKEVVMGQTNTDASVRVSSTKSDTPCRCAYRFQKNYVTNTVAVSLSGVMSVPDVPKLWIPVAHRIGSKRTSGNRSIIAKFPVATQLHKVLKHVNRLHDTRNFLSRQLPPEMNERKQFTLDEYRQKKTDPRHKATLVQDKLYLAGKLQTRYLHPSLPSLNPLDPRVPVEVGQSNPVEDLGSTFFGFAAHTSSQEDICTVRDQLLQRPDVASASDLMCAYRIQSGNKPQYPPSHYLGTGRLPNSFYLSPTDPNELREKYGSVFTVWLGPKPVVILSGYETLKEALVDQGEEFGGRASYPILLEVTKGYGPLASSGTRWRDMRRFSIVTLKNFGMGRKSIEERVQEEAGFLVNAFRDIGDSAFNPNNLLCNAVSNVICSIVFGKRFEYNDPQFKFLQHGLEGYFGFLSSSNGQLFNLFPKLMWCLPGSHHKLFQHLQRIRDYFRQEAEIRADTFDANCPRDYIEAFLVQMQEQRDKPGSEFHYDNLISSIWTLFSAGTETTTSTLRHSLLMMMKYPHIQDRVQKEIDEVVGSARAPSIQDRQDMPYTDAVIHEIQRSMDLAPTSVPHKTMKDTEFKNYCIPEGTMVLPLLSSALSDPKLWKNPHVFDPENFLNENGTFKKNDAFLSFGLGKRACLGEGLARVELFLFFTSLLQRFTFIGMQPPEELDTEPVCCSFGRLPIQYNCYIKLRE
ncbi:hypothetical protein GJAV_G00057760 [Gymnothorax javanicus]|nr:hypothetical protein GJAV_G00057760 [Gymnothorax javanicus]